MSKLICHSCDEHHIPICTTLWSQIQFLEQENRRLIQENKLLRKQAELDCNQIKKMIKPWWKFW